MNLNVGIILKEINHYDNDAEKNMSVLAEILNYYSY